MPGNKNFLSPWEIPILLQAQVRLIHLAWNKSRTRKAGAAIITTGPKEKDCLFPIVECEER